MGKEYKMKLRLVLATVLFLALGVYSVFQVLEHTDLSSLDNLLPGGGGAYRRVDREVPGNTTTAAPESTTPPGTTAGGTTTGTITTSSSSPVVTTTTAPPETKPQTTPGTKKDTTAAPKGSTTVASKGTTSKSPTSTTTRPPTTTTTPLPCSDRPFPLAQVCNLSVVQTEGYLGAGVVLEELSDTFFNSIVLDALATRCGNGSWCLGYDLDKDLLLGDSLVYMQYCDLQQCLQTIPSECMTPERQLVIATLKLLCDARMLNVSDRCILGIKKMTHVALVDEVVSVNETGPSCSIGNSGECPDGCLELGQQLKCMWAACYNEMDAAAFTGYGQWKWALHGAMDNSTDVCNHNNTQCSEFSDSTVLELKVFQQMLYKIQQNGPAVLAGIVTALVVTVAGFGIIFWACAKKVYVYYEYSRDRVEYTEVMDSNQNTEDDTDEEDVLHPA